MTEYKRHQGKSYMVLRMHTDITGYEYAMMSEHKIPGLLPVRMTESDGCTEFWYDISGRQALSDWMERKQEGKEFLKKILSALFGALERTGEYLLCDDGISLAPEQIFLDAKGDEISFCYLPFEKTDVAESLRAFMEYYISHMQHSCREEAQVCYEAYEKSQQERVELEEMLKILFAEKELKFMRPTEAERRNESSDLREEEKEKPKKESFLNEAMKKAEFKKKFEKKIEKMAHFGTLQKRKGFSMKKERNSGEPYVFAPVEQEAKERSQTVLLGSETERTLGELKYEGSGTGPNLKIETSVFLIGSRKEEADGVIEDDTVSRIHARITKEGEDYYLEDLNSTNGTYRNGELLNYKEKVRLEKNDRISFAKEGYRFV